LAAIIDMPRKRTVGNRESKQLSWVGGQAGRLQFQDSNWYFDNLSHFVTPTPYFNNDSTASNNSTNNEVESESDNEEEEDNDSVLSSHTLSDDSASTNDSSIEARKHNGNVIIHLPSLQATLNSIACCRFCAKNSHATTVEDFVAFCETEQQTVLESYETMPIDQQIEFLRKKMDVRQLFNRWKTQLNTNITATVPIQVGEPHTFGIATSFQLECKRCDILGNGSRWRWKNHSASYESVTRRMEALPTKSELCNYELNLRLCLAMQLMGVGGEHAKTLTSFLDLPESLKWPRNFRILEQFLHKSVEKIKCESQEQAVEKEIYLTNTPDSPIEQSLVEDEVPRFRIEACYDMGWQVRSSGGKYGSSTGHGLLIGALSKKVLDSIVFNKKCAKCTKRKNSNVPHNCMKNFDGSSKSMEAAALTRMLIRMPEEKGVSICSIITDDDSNGRAKSRHVCNGGILPDTVEEPTFLADPSHRKRVFARPIYNLSNLPKKKSAVTKPLASHLKYCYGACVKRNRHKTAEELSAKVHNILDHICGVHDQCETAWCYDKKAIEHNLPYNPPVDHRMDKEKYPETYQQLKEHFNYYASVEMMRYCTHPHDTQTNEALNQAIANVAPKSVCYSGTISLNSRIGLIIGIHNMGLHSFFDGLFTTVGMSMTNVLGSFLKWKELEKERKKTYQQRFDVKIRRSKSQKKALQDIYKERTDVSYGHAVGLPMNNNKRQRKASRVESSIDDKQAKKCKCGSTEHLRVTHKNCPMNKKKNKNTAAMDADGDSTSVTSKQNIQNMVSTMCLLQDDNVSSNSEESDIDTYHYNTKH